jgi:hypothetical protein
MPMLKDRRPHRYAVPRIARIPAVSRCRAAPTAAATVSSKMASSLSPAAVSSSKSGSVMRSDRSRTISAYELIGLGNWPPLPAATRTASSVEPGTRRPRDATPRSRPRVGRSGPRQHRPDAMFPLRSYYLTLLLAQPVPVGSAVRAGDTNRPRRATADSQPCAAHCLGGVARGGQRNLGDKIRRARTPVWVKTILTCDCTVRTEITRRSAMSMVE